MKKLYSLICAGFLLSLTASAQFTGGTYTAVTSGNWVPTSAADPTIWVSNPGAPPSRDNLVNGVNYCNNCLISLQIPGGGTVVLNTGVSLTGGSELLIGPGVTLQIAPSHSGTIQGANLINLTDLNAGQQNRIVWQDNTAKLDASQLVVGTDAFDGVFTSVQNNPQGTDFTFTKQIGVAPRGINVTATTTTITDAQDAVFGNSLVGPHTLLDNNGVISLPIVLTSFTAALDQDVVNLAWTTSEELNASHIAIQRSIDAGSHWATIGSEQAKNGGKTVTSYTFADPKPAGGASEYRLQLVDLDGKATYSQVRTVRNGLIGSVSVFPNPAHNYINVALGGSATENLLVRLYSQSGQLLQLKNVANAGGTTVALSVSGYPEGNYIIVVNGANGAKQVSNVLVSK